ncbi:hypothetical protein [Peribacillus simplex]|uniref:hypothetical protein n=1 Tax=Peribacillus simplex TaxID=1478 RepID=UPI003336E1BE
MKYEVNSAFIDKNTNEEYAAGEFYETSNEDRAAFLKMKGFLGSEVDSSIENILDKNAQEVVKSLSSSTPKGDLDVLYKRESEGKNRVTVKEHIEKLLKGEDDESSKA